MVRASSPARRSAWPECPSAWPAGGPNRCGRTTRSWSGHCSMRPWRQPPRSHSWPAHSSATHSWPGRSCRQHDWAIAFCGGLLGLPHKGMHQLRLAHVVPAQDLALPGHFRQLFGRSSLEICCDTHGYTSVVQLPHDPPPNGWANRFTPRDSNIPSRTSLLLLSILAGTPGRASERTRPGRNPGSVHRDSLLFFPAADAMHPSPSR